MTTIETGRRQLMQGSLFASLAALAGCRPARPSDAPADANASPTPEGLSPDAVAAAELLAGVEYSPSERQMIVDSIEGQLAALEARRSYMPDNDVAPATVFDPRPQGFVLPRPATTEVVAGDAEPAARPTDPADLAHAPVSALGHWLRRGTLTSRELTEIYLERLERLGPKLECVVTLTPALARAQADAADAELKAGNIRGPLHGIPWGAKDLLDTTGIETSWGATTHRGRTPTRNAVVVDRLAEAGAVLVAKLTLGALAYGDQWFGGRTNNPWNLEEGSSGSSAGPGAAVAAGLVGFAIGTETMGSIVSPSMRNGVCGLRPTFGRVARTGAMALCWSLDKIGPMCRRAEGCAAVLGAINGGHPTDPSSLDVPFGYDGRAHDPGRLDDLCVGYDPRWFEGETPAADIERDVLDRLRERGAVLVEITLPKLPYGGLSPILSAEAAACFEELTAEDRDDLLRWQEPQAWPNLWRMARFIPAVDLVQAQRLRRRVQQAIAQTFARTGVSLMISPSFAGSMLSITNFIGTPSLTLRAGFVRSPARTLYGQPGQGEPHRVPHGITLWGRLFDEVTLVRTGRALEEALGVWSERPPLT